PACGTRSTSAAAARTEREAAVPGTLREHALDVWWAAVAAARADDLVRAALADPAGPLGEDLARADRILVVGAGKAGAAMVAGVEQALAGLLYRVHGWVNVPAPAAAEPAPGHPVRLHA